MSIDNNMSNEITIVTVNYNTSDFVELMVEAFHRLSTKRYKIIICDNGSDEKNIIHLVKIQKQNPNIEIFFRNQSAAGSIGHAEALDLLMKKVESPYCLVMDADCCVFKRDWDQILLEKLNEKVKVYGTPRLLESGDTLDDFPTTFSTIYDTEAFLSLGCSFMPGLGGAKENQDTGYLITKNFREAGLGYRNLVAKNTRHYKKGFFGNYLCAEYYLDEECRDLFSCHFSRGSSSGKDKYKDGLLLRIPILKKFVRQFLGDRERRAWIRKSYELLESLN